MSGADPEVVAALRRMGLLGADSAPRFERLTGGVSSDIWKVVTPAGPICVKRALASLRVAGDWQAPIERNAYEAAWMRRAADVVPQAVPALLGQDDGAGVLAMAYLDPATHPVWKQLLKQGRADPEVAAAVGDRLGRVHCATADDPQIAVAFPTDRIFHDIRLEPYLLATARVHTDLAEQLEALAGTTAAKRRCLVHGDVSPKNILIGPEGPVFLDAECAWYGDPAFDLAFCLNHLLLKCLWTPGAACRFQQCFESLAETYRAHVTWEPRPDIEVRAARLLPGLLLARVDGKSPVEYLTAQTDKDRVRRVARALLMHPVRELAAVADAWRRELGR